MHVQHNKAGKTYDQTQQLQPRSKSYKYKFRTSRTFIQSYGRPVRMLRGRNGFRAYFMGLFKQWPIVIYIDVSRRRCAFRLIHLFAFASINVNRKGGEGDAKQKEEE